MPPYDVAIENGSPYPGFCGAQQLHLVSRSSDHQAADGARAPIVQRRKLNLKAIFKSTLSYSSFKRLVPGAVNLDFIGSTCTASPLRSARDTSPCTVTC
jgi:hypothetical protein